MKYPCKIPVIGVVLDTGLLNSFAPFFSCFKNKTFSLISISWIQYYSIYLHTPYKTEKNELQLKSFINIHNLAVGVFFWVFLRLGEAKCLFRRGWEALHQGGRGAQLGNRLIDTRDEVGRLCGTGGAPSLRG